MNTNYLNGKWYFLLEDNGGAILEYYTESKTDSFHSVNFDCRDGYYTIDDIDGNRHYWKCASKRSVSEWKKQGYSEITFDEFFKNVLNQSVGYELY